MPTEYERLFELSFDMLAILDQTGRFEDINQAFTSRLGWSLRSLQNLRLWDLVVPSGSHDLEHLKQNISSGHPLISIDSQVRSRDGTLRMLRWSAYPDLEKQKIYLIIQEDQPRNTIREIMRPAIESLPTGILIVTGGKILYANRLAGEIFGYAQDELIGKPIEMLVPTSARHRHAGERGKYEQQPFVRLMGSKLDLIGLHKDGHLLDLDIGLNPVKNLEELDIVCSILPLTDGKTAKIIYAERIHQLENEISALDKLSLTDELTTIYNRRALFQQLEHHYRIARKESQPFSFVLIDVDDFKSYNDTFGHIAGDRVLRTIADIMTRSIRRTEIMARYGGEEFGMILPFTDADEARQLAERMRKLIEEYNWPLRQVTISAGVASLVPQKNLVDTPETINNFVIMADQALYQSKLNGKNQVTSFRDLSTSHQENLSEWKIQHETPNDH